MSVKLILPIFLLLLFLGSSTQQDISCPNGFFPQTSVLKAFGGKQADAVQDIATDSNGNVFMTGNFAGVSKFGSITLTSSGGLDLFVVKLNVSMAVEWAVSAGYQADDSGVSLTIHQNKNVIVTGYTTSKGYKNIPTGANPNFVRIKTMMLVVSIADGSIVHQDEGIEEYPSNFGSADVLGLPSTPVSVFMNRNKEIVIVGADGIVPTQPFNYVNRQRIYLQKFDDRFTPTEGYHTAAANMYANIARPFSVAQDDNDNIYVCSQLSGSLQFGATSIQIPRLNLFVLKFDRNLSLVWVSEKLGADAVDEAWNLPRVCYLTVTNDGRDIFVAGTDLSNMNPGVGFSWKSIFVRKLNQTGHILSSKDVALNWPEVNSYIMTVRGVSLIDGKIHVLGSTSGNVAFGDISLSSDQASSKGFWAQLDIGLEAFSSVLQLNSTASEAIKLLKADNRYLYMAMGFSDKLSYGETDMVVQSSGEVDISLLRLKSSYEQKQVTITGTYQRTQSSKELLATQDGSIYTVVGEVFEYGYAFSQMRLLKLNNQMQKEWEAVFSFDQIGDGVFVSSSLMQYRPEEIMLMVRASSGVGRPTSAQMTVNGTHYSLQLGSQLVSFSASGQVINIISLEGEVDIVKPDNMGAMLIAARTYLKKVPYFSLQDSAFWQTQTYRSYVDLEVDSRGDIFVITSAQFEFESVDNLLKLSSEGEQLWGLASPEGYCRAVKILLGDDVIFWIGTVEKSCIFGNTRITSNGGKDVLVMRVSTAGVVVKYSVMGGIADDVPTAASFNEQGHLLITGTFRNVATFGKRKYSSSGENDIFVTLVDRELNTVWTETAQGIGAEYSNGITVQDQRIILSGTTTTKNVKFGSSLIVHPGPNTIQGFLISLKDIPFCFSCGQGAFLTSESICWRCPRGTFSPDGSTDCQECLPGTYSRIPSESCESCPIGTYNSNYGASSKEQCVQCPAGTMSARMGAVQCELCSIGNFSDTAGSETCSRCNPGSFTNVKGSILCRQCLAGYFTSEYESTSCQPCKIGYVSTSLGSSSCSQCPAGTFSNETASTTCTPCAAGFISANGATSCQPCQAGYYANTEGSVACAMCPSGSWSSEASARCIPCPAGHYSNSRGTGCIACSSGEYLDAAANKCVKCKPGTFANTTGSVQCTACSSGSYSAIDGASTCSPCKLGEFQSDNGSSGCMQCNAGYHTPSIGATSCVPCPSGTYSDIAGASQCKLCPPGSFQPSEAQTTCDICSIGTINPMSNATGCSPCPYNTIAQNATTCVACPVGTITLSQAAWKCVRCQAGTFYKEGRCHACSAGTYSDKEAVEDTCFSCPPGFYSATLEQDGYGAFGETQMIGARKCNPCPNNLYSNVSGAASCIPCDNGKVCGIGTIYPIAVSKANEHARLLDPYFDSSETAIKRNSNMKATYFKVVLSSVVAGICVILIILFIVTKACQKVKAFNWVSTKITKLDSWPLHHFVSLGSSPVKKQHFIGGALTILMVLLVLFVLLFLGIDVIFSNWVDNTSIVPEQVMEPELRNLEISGPVGLNLTLFNFPNAASCTPTIKTSGILKTAEGFIQTLSEYNDGSCAISFWCTSCILAGQTQGIDLSWDGNYIMANAIEYTAWVPHFLAGSLFNASDFYTAPELQAIAGSTPTIVSLALTKSYFTSLPWDYFLYNVFTEKLTSSSNLRARTNAGYVMSKFPVALGSVTSLESAIPTQLRIQVNFAIDSKIFQVRQDAKYYLITWISFILPLVKLVPTILVIIMKTLEEHGGKVLVAIKKRRNKLAKATDLVSANTNKIGIEFEGALKPTIPATQELGSKSHEEDQQDDQRDERELQELEITPLKVANANEIFEQAIRHPRSPKSPQNAVQAKV